MVAYEADGRVGTMVVAQSMAGVYKYPLCCRVACDEQTWWLGAWRHRKAREGHNEARWTRVESHKMGPTAVRFELTRVTPIDF